MVIVVSTYNDKIGEMVVLIISIAVEFLSLNLKVSLTKRMDMILLIRNICIQLYMQAVSVS